MNWYTSKGSMGQGIVIDEETGRNVAVAYDEKDAPLLAAAPALLEACEKIAATVDGLDMNAELWEDLHAAIAKAKE